MAIAKVNGVDIWYQLSGSGNPLYLLPGLGLDHNYYRFAVPLLEDHATVVAVDPRGIGQSGKPSPAENEYSAEVWADDFAALARSLGHRRIDVLGSSLGGSMAMALALRHPDIVRSLTVIGGFSEIDRAIEMNMNFRKKVIAALGMGEVLADFMSMSTMTREFMETEEGHSVMKTIQGGVKANPAEYYVAFINAVLRWGGRMEGHQLDGTWTRRLREISVPTLVIAGDNDYFIPAKFSKIIADSIPGALYREVAFGGHIPFIEKPQETAELVTSFLRGLDAAAGATTSPQQAEAGA